MILTYNLVVSGGDEANGHGLTMTMTRTVLSRYFNNMVGVGGREVFRTA